MTTLQKTIKYLALAFAVFLIVAIFGGIISAVAGLSWIFGEDDISGEEKSYSLSQQIESLQIDLSAGSLEIRVGESFQLESNHKYLKVTETEGNLKISETKKFHHGSFSDVHITLTIPEKTHFSTANISSGAGTVEIQYLQADQCTLDLGAGEVTIAYLQIHKEISIDGGAGKLTLRRCFLQNLDLDMGVGELNVYGQLLGDCDLNFGIGQANIFLTGSPDSYQISFVKGLGDAKLDGEEMQDGHIYGTGPNQIHVEGGIGSIAIQFEKAKA